MVTDAQTAAWARELSATEDEIGRIGVELRETQKEARQALKHQRERARHLLALISGREGEQLDLPSTPPRWGFSGLRGVYHLWASKDIGEAECGETTDQSIDWAERPKDSDRVCLDCLQTAHGAEWRKAFSGEPAKCTGAQKNGKPRTAAGRFDGEIGPVCATHINAETRAKKRKR